MNYDFCIFSSKNYYLFLFVPDLKVIASKINFIYDNKTSNFSLILWSEPHKKDGHLAPAGSKIDEIYYAEFTLAIQRPTV